MSLSFLKSPWSHWTWPRSTWRRSKSASRHHSPAVVGDEHQKDAHDGGQQRRHHVTTHERGQRRADHDDDEPGRGQRRQGRSNAQERWQNEAESTQHLRDTDEPQEPQGQRHGSLHLLDRQDQLHAAGEQEEQREQHLNDPERVDHRSVFSLPWRPTYGRRGPVPDRPDFEGPTCAGPSVNSRLPSRTRTDIADEAGWSGCPRDKQIRSRYFTYLCLRQ